MKTLTKLVRDEQKLLARKPKDFVRLKGRRSPSWYHPAEIESKGYVPKNLIAAYLLIKEYKRKKEEAESVEDKIEFTSLEAGAKCRWEIGFAELCEGIEKKPGSRIKVLRDWTIAVITPRVKE